MLDIIVEERAAFDFNIISALDRIIKRLRKLAGTQEQPVEIEYVAPVMTGSCFDASQHKFFIVRFTGEDVKPAERERAVIIQDDYKDGSVFWLARFDRNTLEYSITETKGSARAVAAAIQEQKVPEWLLPQLENAAANAFRKKNQAALEVQHTIAAGRTDLTQN